MKPRAISDRVLAVGAIDWDRRLFDSLIPLPDGTSYNAYLVHGSEKTALLDTVDPTKKDELMSQLAGIERIDFVISHHAEQDHSGAIADVLAKYPQAKVVASTKAKGMLLDLLEGVPEDRVITVEDGEELSLGDKTLRFIYMPWVHWPETMITYLLQDRILFTCDLFGSHLATSDLYADEARVYEPAKRYYAEIMMPFRRAIARHLERVRQIDPAVIAPSHGPVYRRPAFIIDAYDEWVSAPPRNRVIVPYITMHGSTARMVEHFVGALMERGVEVEQFNLASADIGKLAVSLVDSATIVVGTPTVLGGPHPTVLAAVQLAAVLNPKLRFAAVVGSYGWGGKAAEQIASAIQRADVEVLAPVLCKGLPRDADFAALESLAQTIADKHSELGFT
jgi:flavorubredoxin